MNKKNFISKEILFEEIADKIWIKKKLVTQIFKELENSLIKHLKKNKEVKIWFWKFIIKEQKPKIIISIHSKKRIKTKKKKNIKFIINNTLKNILN